MGLVLPLVFLVPSPSFDVAVALPSPWPLAPSPLVFPRLRLRDESRGRSEPYWGIVFRKVRGLETTLHTTGRYKARPPAANPKRVGGYFFFAGDFFLAAFLVDFLAAAFFAGAFFADFLAAFFLVAIWSSSLRISRVVSTRPSSSHPPRDRKTSMTSSRLDHLRSHDHSFDRTTLKTIVRHSRSSFYIS